MKRVTKASAMNPLPLALWESVYRQRVARERVGTDRPPVLTQHAVEAE
jgi:hypothetical protein